VKWTKSGALVPGKINGKYWMYYLADAKGKDTQMGKWVSLTPTICSTGQRASTTRVGLTRKL